MCPPPPFPSRTTKKNSKMSSAGTEEQISNIVKGTTVTVDGRLDIAPEDECR